MTPTGRTESKPNIQSVTPKTDEVKKIRASFKQADYKKVFQFAATVWTTTPSHSSPLAQLALQVMDMCEDVIGQQNGRPLTSRTTHRAQVPRPPRQSPPPRPPLSSGNIEKGGLNPTTSQVTTRPPPPPPSNSRPPSASRRRLQPSDEYQD